ncbi:MmcQ/YjbR family DNA-binding protein [Brumimicrobium oceani]|uniref:MmcQ-like protein n=1 Tax=Brumimicrobium oceani TaxID=2100725 RepID=A0A2U2XDJ1_9FLAO|nr:MmcQ/YjbR family DNA-binding protein [Brumimicrobium oceani]PWH85852.1 MmcQ-like protein [Brumimicrobium oceani]
MNLETFREYCLSKAHVDEALPFDDVTLVFRVNNKMFALLSLREDREKSCNLKCDPERALELRSDFTGITPGYHMSKKHWNTLSFNEDVPDSLIYELIDHSYDLVFKSFSKKIQKELSQ